MCAGYPGRRMRTFLIMVLLVLLALAGCSVSDDNGVPQLSSCTVDGQKQFVLDTMNDVYFSNNLLPAGVNAKVVAALVRLETGFCPPLLSGPPGRAKRASYRNEFQESMPQPPWREFAGAW